MPPSGNELMTGSSFNLASILFRFSINAPLTVEDFWTLRCDMAEKLRQRLAALPTDALIELKQQVLDAFRSYMKGAGVSFPAEVLIVSGRK